MINREDMLELTRRMTPARCCFDRLAGCYLDEEGYIDGAFNIHFLKLNTREKDYNLKLAKTIPFSKTNEELTMHRFPGKTASSRDLYGLLRELNSCGLKNDEMMEIFYEALSEKLELTREYAIYLFHGVYDIKKKAGDKTALDSEEVYNFLICTIGPWSGDYVAGQPSCGFLYPAFTDRSSDPAHILVYTDASDQEELGKKLKNMIQ